MPDERGRLSAAGGASALELERTAAMLDAVFANVPVGLGLFDLELRFVHLSAELAASRGLRREECIGRTLSEVDPKVAPIVEPGLRLVLDTRTVHTDDHSIDDGGFVRHWRSTRFPVLDRDGELVGVGTCVVELTELAEAYARERAEVALLDALFENAPVGIALFDGQLRYARVNERYAGPRGPAPFEHVGCTIDDVHPGMGEQVEPGMREIQRTGVPVVGLETVGRDGRVYRSSQYPVLVAEGEVPGIAAIVDDVSDLKRVEALLEEALAAESEARSFLDGLLDNAPFAITFVDRDLRYRRVNRKAAETAGLTVAEMLGRTPQEVYPEVAERVTREIRRVLETGTPVVDSPITIESRVEPGRPQHLLVSRYAVRDDSDAIVGVAQIRADVTALRRAEERLDELLTLERSVRLEIDAAKAELERQALTDQLTGLANRRAFTAAFEAALAHARDRHAIGLLYLDLDGFKTVNDTYGHDAGDELLRAVAGRLSGCTKDGDVVARLGGDEFLVLLPKLEPADAAAVAASVAARVEAVIGRPFALAVADALVSASVGVATYPADGADAEALLSTADGRMYEAKRTRKSRRAA